MPLTAREKCALWLQVKFFILGVKLMRAAADRYMFSLLSFHALPLADSYKLHRLLQFKLEFME